MLMNYLRHKQKQNLARIVRFVTQASYSHRSLTIRMNIRCGTNLKIDVV